jgi:hypothetical protein
MGTYFTGCEEGGGQWLVVKPSGADRLNLTD